MAKADAYTPGRPTVSTDPAPTLPTLFAPTWESADFTWEASEVTWDGWVSPAGGLMVTAHNVRE